MEPPTNKKTTIYNLRRKIQNEHCYLIVMILQKLWLAGLTWDEPLTEDIKNDWVCFEQGLQQLEHILLPRWFGTSSRSAGKSQCSYLCASTTYRRKIYTAILQKTKWLH